MDWTLKCLPGVACEALGCPEKRCLKAKAAVPYVPARGAAGAAGAAAPRGAELGPRSSCGEQGGSAEWGQEPSQGTCDCTEHLFCLVEREQAAGLGSELCSEPFSERGRCLSAAIPEPWAECEVLWAEHWEKAQSCEGSSGASWVTAKFNTWTICRKYETGECGS